MPTPGTIAIIILIVLILVVVVSCIQIVQQSKAYVVERLGAFHSVWGVGMHFRLPFIERVVKKVSLKEQVADFDPQPVITKDNVTMQIDTVIYFQITDPKLYTYGVEYPMSAIENLTATTLRNIIGELELDQSLTSRDTINAKMRSILDEATDPWGIKVNRVELKNILPPREIQNAMEKQMKAERERRESILQAEGEKASKVLIAEGEKQSTLLRADAAKQAMIERFELSDIQASAIIEMRLRALTGLEYGKLTAERDDLTKLIAHLKDVLENVGMQMQIVKDELLEIKEKYGDERRSEIVYASEEFNPEDFYADDDMVITISHMGYIKRTPLAEYRTQNRGGVGAKGSATRDEDFIEHIYVASMHNTMLFFTEKGRCYWLKVYEIPEGARSSKGRAIQNVIQIEPDDKVRAYINVKRLNDAEYVNNNFIIMCTKDGTIKKTKLEAYSRPRQNGVNAIVIREGDQLIEAKLTSGNAEVMIAAREGKAIRFNESTVRPIGRVGAGVRGISIEESDEVIGMICVEPDSTQDVLVLSENGYGKRTDLDEYRITNRGGKGVKTINVTEKTGKLISIQAVTDDNDLMIINRSGLTIRTAVSQIRLAGRATQGVRIINLREGDAIASVMAVPGSEEEELAAVEGGENPAPAATDETSAAEQ